MSSLSRYLAPTRGARQNPGYVAEWRHAEGGPWLLLASARSRKDAASELALPTVTLTQGDLARVRDPKGQIVGFFVMASEGIVALPSGGAPVLRGLVYNRSDRGWFYACGYDWERAWDGCPRADWMLSLAGRVDVDRRLLVLAACACAETVLPYVPQGEERPQQALETARRWARGEATIEEDEDAAGAAQAAGNAADTGPGWGAARAAAGNAAQAAGDAAMVAENAAYAVWAVNRVVGAVSWSVARDDQETAKAAALATMAVLVRREIPLWRLALALAAKAPS